jgi:cell division protease FtsH
VPAELDVVAFGHDFQAFMKAMSQIAPPPEPSPLHQRLTRHLGRSPGGLPVVTEDYPPYDHPNVQVALDAYLARPGRTSELIGVSGSAREHFGLADIIEGAAQHHQFGLGAVDYVTMPVGVAVDRTCVSFGMYLVDDGGERFAVLLRAGNRRTGDHRVQLEVLCAAAEVANRFLAELRELVAGHNVFRGQVLSFEPHQFGHGIGPLRFHERPDVPAEDVVLPPGTLDAVHRQSAGIARHRDRLIAAGHHLKRGILLFGPPGTGKTHTLRHLMNQLPDTTVVILTGLGLHFVREACALARLVPPALVILEDVDLIAEERATHPGGETNPLLFQVLNEMDGVAGDADIAFVLTTNRADLIEPALAQRPGRVDLAVEVPLPDEPGRRRLLSLYGSHLALTGQERDEVVAATAGVTASYFAELARRAELLAATAGDDRTGITHVRAALDELNASRTALAHESRRRPRRGHESTLAAG